MMRKGIAYLLALCIFCSTAFSVQASTVTTFTDVDPSHWGAAYISQCHEMGLMIGTSDTTFEPDGTVTVAQAITMAVRIHDYCTGSKTKITSSGGNWYDGYVVAAVKLGIMSETEFDSYTRPATRAELAGMLGRSVPKRYLKAINTITELPDVDGQTPYAEEIFTLYKAGVLTGNDAYGTYTPYQYITRVSLAALACRLAKEDTRVKLTLMEKPVDFTVYTTNYRLVMAGVPIYGVLEIDGKYYIPIQTLDDNNTLPNRAVYINEYTDRITVQFNPGNLKEGQSVIIQTHAPVTGKALGTAELSDQTLIYTNGSKKEEIDNAIYLIDGRYPMVSLSALGATRKGNDFVLYESEAGKVKIVSEADLVGDRAAALQRDTTRNTVIAIHDYLVNTLKYDPRVSQSYTTDAEMEKVDNAWNSAAAIYQYENNISLATGYGVCQNYAELFQAFCARLGIPSCMVSGVGNGGSHAWNVVYVDGKWLYVDCTFDDPVGKTQTLQREYCLVGPNTMAIRHAWRGEDYPMPSEYDPAWEQLDPNNITSADMFRKCLIAQMMQKKTSFSLRTTVSGAYGGNACVYKFDTGFYYMSCSYNKAPHAYDFKVDYWY